VHIPALWTRLVRANYFSVPKPSYEFKRQSRLNGQPRHNGHVVH